ncbi:HIT domain-containing protein [Williamsia herbipolensis]|uniref:HIT domain-containing protein n=1 Tax=Williamsia herbipolensis TaxID=1603258 RepID=A0AAU4K7D2_9NOCA|nr:HIT domain-containing protein [Williamsia herbipolensis]
MIYSDEQVVVTHRLSPTDGMYVPGYLVIETRRHAAGLPSLVESEVAAVARAAWRMSCALERELHPQFVFSLIAGRSVAHVHQHVFVRPRGTPDTVAWTDVDSWSERPRVTAAELVSLCDRLRSHSP